MASSSAAGAQLPVLSPLPSNPVYLRVRLLGMFCCLWPSAGVAGPGEMLCCLPMFSSQSEPERSLLSFLTPTTLSGSSQPAGAVPIMESGCGPTSLKRQIDTIALHAPAAELESTSQYVLSRCPAGYSWVQVAAGNMWTTRQKG